MNTRPDAPRVPGKVMIMSSGERGWDRKGVEPETESGETQRTPGKRRLSVMAAVVALATVAGALGGALATAGLMHFAAAGSTASSHLEASVARIDADLLALKAGVEHTSKVGLSQYNKTTDRLDKVEKAQAEPAAKLTRLSEVVEKLRTAAPAAPAPVAAAPAGRPRTSPARSRRRQRLRRHPRFRCLRQKPRWRGCRRSRAGYCATSTMASP